MSPIRHVMADKNKLFRLSYRINIQRAAVLSLLFVILLFQLLPKRIETKKVELEPVFLSFTIEEIPVTRQTVRRGRPAPKKPVVPLPSEDPSIPEDLTIDETLIQWDAGDSPFGRSGLTTGRADTIPPRPLVQVMPEYPESLRKQKIEGSVRLLLKVDGNGSVINVVIAENSTGSDLCAEAALEAAKRSSYLPARAGERMLEMWTSCVFTFKPE